MTASEVVVTGFLALALVAYVISGGADFGVGIVEWLAADEERPAVRRAGEKAIAPIWEANHVWIIVALVILFVAFPAIHVQLTKSLHVPLVLMLVGIVLRGSAFTFRYYDVDRSGGSDRLWTALFRGGSLLVPLVFGHLAAAMSRGQMRAEPTTVFESYVAPWIGAFPASAGIFTVALFAWLASVFLVGEQPTNERGPWVARARRWTVVMLIAGAATTAAAGLEAVPWLAGVGGRPELWAIVALTTVGLVLAWRSLTMTSIWPARIAAGGVTTGIVGGYFGAVYPTAVELADGPPLTWTGAAAPSPTLDAMALALLAGSLLILPGLGWLYRIFAGRSAAAEAGDQ